MCPFKTFGINAPLSSSCPSYDCITIITFPLTDKRKTDGGGKYPETESE